MSNIEILATFSRKPLSERYFRKLITTQSRADSNTKKFYYFLNKCFQNSLSMEFEPTKLAPNHCMENALSNHKFNIDGAISRKFKIELQFWFVLAHLCICVSSRWFLYVNITTKHLILSKIFTRIMTLTVVSRLNILIFQERRHNF